ncbi:unnamed protein product [Nesidiocoris tenuis]|uniref:Uncharacterized protein n=1 Tax=Nesidiocoris tenuis TaxID=355587 RepID=A0A6H5HFM4_9HEMI|nr:unnamed protein product [Nesidiocoris tenuis]
MIWQEAGELTNGNQMVTGQAASAYGPARLQMVTDQVAPDMHRVAPDMHQVAPDMHRVAPDIDQVAPTSRAQMKATGRTRYRDRASLGSDLVRQVVTGREMRNGTKAHPGQVVTGPGNWDRPEYRPPCGACGGYPPGPDYGGYRPEDRYGPGYDRFRPGDDRFRPGDDRFRPGDYYDRPAYGPGDDRYRPVGGYTPSRDQERPMPPKNLDRYPGHTGVGATYDFGSTGDTSRRGEGGETKLTSQTVQVVTSGVTSDVTSFVTQAPPVFVQQPNFVVPQQQNVSHEVVTYVPIFVVRYKTYPNRQKN